MLLVSLSQLRTFSKTRISPPLQVLDGGFCFFSENVINVFYWALEDFAKNCCVFFEWCVVWVVLCALDALKQRFWRLSPPVPLSVDSACALIRTSLVTFLVAGSISELKSTRTKNNFVFYVKVIECFVFCHFLHFSLLAVT